MFGLGLIFLRSREEKTDSLRQSGIARVLRFQIYLYDFYHLYHLSLPQKSSRLKLFSPCSLRQVITRFEVKVIIAPSHKNASLRERT